MKGACFVALVLAGFAWPAHAVTVVNGVVHFTQADALAGNVTQGDAAGFPVTVSVSGSYRLAGNLAPPAGVNGIEVTAPDVTLDFAGFRLAGSGTAKKGIVGKQRALTVRDGTIRGFAEDGIRSSGQYLMVLGMRITDNGGAGIIEDPGAGSVGFARIHGSIVVKNGNGIACSSSCHVESNDSSNNGGSGVTMSGNGGVVIGNTLTSNSQYGLVQISVLSLNLATGFGNNTIFNNSLGPTNGLVVPLQANACRPQSC